MKRNIVFAVLAILCCTACEKDENGNRVTYYKTIGEGYVWDATNNRPFQNAEIRVVSRLIKGYDCWFPPCATTEIFTTDENGYFQIRFAKRLNNSKIKCYNLNISLPSSYFFWYRETNEPLLQQEYFYPKDIENKKTMVFDTIKYYQTNVR